MVIPPRAKSESHGDVPTCTPIALASACAVSSCPFRPASARGRAAAARRRSPRSAGPSRASPAGTDGQRVDGSPRRTSRFGSATVYPLKSDGNGFFEIDLGGLASHRAVIDGSGVVERETRLSAIGAGPDIDDSLELRPPGVRRQFRASNARLQRWTSRPSLVVLATVMDYRNGSEQSDQLHWRAVDGARTKAHLMAHLTEGLALLTGQHLLQRSPRSRSSVRPAGGRVDTMRARDRLWSAATPASPTCPRPLATACGRNARRDHRRRRDVSRSGVRSRRLSPAPAADPRARPRPGLPARRDPDRRS